MMMLLLLLLMMMQDAMAIGFSEYIL